MKAASLVSKNWKTGSVTTGIRVLAFEKLAASANTVIDAPITDHPAACFNLR